MTKDMIQQFRVLVDFLGQSLGPDYEIVLHDLENPKKSVTAIANGHISGREVGSPITDAALSLITNREYEKNDFLVNYKGVTKEGYVIRSSTMFIKNEAGIPIGLLCINFDDSRFIDLHDQLLSIAHPLDFLKKYSTHTIRDLDIYGSESDANLTEKLAPDIDSLMKTIYQDTVSELKIPTERLNQNERLKIIENLKEKGFFKLKGSVQYAARHLMCSTSSIYRYINSTKE